MRSIGRRTCRSSCWTSGFISRSSSAGTATPESRSMSTSLLRLWWCLVICACRFVTITNSQTLSHPAPAWRMTLARYRQDNGQALLDFDDGLLSIVFSASVPYPVCTNWVNDHAAEFVCRSQGYDGGTVYYRRRMTLPSNATSTGLYVGAKVMCNSTGCFNASVTPLCQSQFSPFVRCSSAMPPG
eukprot:scpid94423/ scgid30842/ 